MSKYLTSIDIMKNNLAKVNNIFARMVEWFCIVDSNIYESKDKIIEYLHSDSKITNIRYEKQFENEFNLEILIFDDDKYIDKPYIKYETKSKTLKTYYNIKFFNTPDIYPFKTADRKVAKLLFHSNKYDNKWIEFINKYTMVEEYRYRMLVSFMRFLNAFYVQPELNRNFDLTKECDKFYVNHVNQFILVYNKIISMNTLPGLGEVYFSILALEEEASKKDDIFYLRSEKRYLLYKTLYYLRKHIFDEDSFSFNIRDKHGISLDTKSDNKYISYIEEEMIYAFIVNKQNVLLFSGFDT